MGNKCCSFFSVGFYSKNNILAIRDMAIKHSTGHLRHHHHQSSYSIIRAMWMWQIIIYSFFIRYLHLMSKYKSLLLTEPCAFEARHMYWPCVCLEMLWRTSDWFVMMTPRVGWSGLLLWYHSIFFIDGFASIRHSKYTSVPFARFFGSRFDPSDNETIGASAKRAFVNGD